MSPRVIGETERAAAAKSAAAALPPISPDEWIEMRVEAGVETAGARAFVALVEELGGEPVVSPSRDSINAKFTGKNGKSFNALQLWKSVVSLPFGYLTSCLQDMDVRREMLESLKDVVGPTSSENLNGHPSFGVSRLADPEVALRLKPWFAAALQKMR